MIGSQQGAPAALPVLYKLGRLPPYPLSQVSMRSRQQPADAALDGICMHPPARCPTGGSLGGELPQRGGSLGGEAPSQGVPGERVLEQGGRPFSRSATGGTCIDTLMARKTPIACRHSHRARQGRGLTLGGLTAADVWWRRAVRLDWTGLGPKLEPCC